MTWRRSIWGNEITLEYGKALRTYSETGGGVRVYGTNGPVGWTDSPLVAGPGVILGRKGAYRGVHFSRESFFVIDTAYYVVPKSDLNMRWLYYAIIYHQLGLIDDGSPIPSTTRAAVYLRELSVPSVSEQRAIAGVLGSLDDKIEQNRRTAQSLERLARAIFKAWFVDFEPVKAKAAGAASFPSMPQDVFDALPTRFVDSEIGPVPEGWEVATVYDLASVIYGAPFKSKLFNDEQNGKPLIRIRDLQTHNPGIYTPEIHPKGRLVNAADIIVGMDGEFRLHYWTGPISWLNQRVCLFDPYEDIPKVFVGESLRRPLAFFEGSKTGTTVIHLGKGDIDTFRFILPPKPTLASFGQTTDPALKLIVDSAYESRKLAELRDYLLPKLLSGEVRVRKGERLVEEAIA